MQLLSSVMCRYIFLKKEVLFTTQVKVPVVVFCLNLYIPSNVKANWLNMTALVLQTQAGVFASVLQKFPRLNCEFKQVLME